jgi:hypothetical protein
MYLAGVPTFVTKYKNWLRDTIGPQLAPKDPAGGDDHNISSQNHMALMADNLNFLNTKIIQRWLKSASPEQQQSLLDISGAIMDQLYQISANALMADPSSCTEVSHVAGQEISCEVIPVCDEWDMEYTWWECDKEPEVKGWTNERLMKVTDLQLQLL